jgi:two-component system, OmpR family, sensor kinase
MFDSVRIRLTLWYMSVLALVLVGFSVVVYTLLSRTLYERVDEGLRAVVEVAIKSLSNDIEEGQSRESAAQSTVNELFNRQQALAIFDESARLLAENTSHKDLYMQLPVLNSIPEKEAHLFTVTEVDDDDDLHRVAVQRVTIPPANIPYIILITQRLETVDDELRALRKILFYAVPISLVVAGLGGWFLARKSLAPVVAMSDQARRIGAENLDRQLPVANPRDELGKLATTFNELLARLNSSFAQQRQFMADASHELRTPISVMHTTADVTLEQKRRDEIEYRDALKIVDEQARRLGRIVEDMFILSRADAGHYQLRKSKFYLDELLEETSRAAEVLASAKDVNVRLTNSPEALVFGDEDLLRQMILNLLDNAIKYTPTGGEVQVRLYRQQEKFMIEISDTGAGIPADAQDHIFKRFYRVDKSRSRLENQKGSGAGLGLAIARWIAEAHNGTLDLLKSDPSGSAFIAKLPIGN